MRDAGKGIRFNAGRRKVLTLLLAGLCAGTSWRAALLKIV